MLQRRELYRWHSFLYAIDERHRSERMASIEAAEANAEASASATCSFTSLDTADWLSSSAFTSPSATLTSHGFTPSPSYPRISPAACIQALDLSRATAHGVTITDHDIHTIATSCPSLRRLNLSHCPSLTDLALQHLATAPCAQHMEALNLAHCVQVTDAGVVPLVCGMAGSLRALNLKSCTLVGDVALEAVARWCGAGLRRLRVNGCSSVTDEGLMALSERCARLTWLDVGSCPLVSDAGVIPVGCRVIHVVNVMMTHAGVDLTHLFHSSWSWPTRTSNGWT